MRLLRRGMMLGARASTSLNPADKAASAVLSNSNLSLGTPGTSTGWVDARGTSSKTSGKWYFEVRTDSVSTPGFPEFGVATSGATLTIEPNGQATVTSMASVGSMFAIGSTAGSFGAAMIAGDVCQVAVDVDNRKLWFRPKATGNWNNVGGADPATNTGGLSIPASGAIFPIGGCNDSTVANANKLTFNFGVGLGYGIPAGFQRWG